VDDRRSMEDKLVMKDATKRSIVRWIHIILGIPIIGYIYSPFEQIPNYAPATRFVFVPMLVLSGLWMWKGHVLRRLFSKRSAQQAAANNA
jgi:thiosulfate reductase cytochrome b subunit